jgi:hypothetical protein
MGNVVGTGRLTGEFVSTLDGNVRKREFYNKIFRQDPEYTYFDYFEQTGRKYDSSERLVEHAEKGSAFENVTILSKVASGTDVVATLSVADHFNGASYPVKKQQVRFQNGTQGVIIAKNTTVATAHTITIRPSRADQDVNTAAVVGQTIVCFSNGKAEGTGQPEGRQARISTFSNKMQIFAETYEIEGSEEASEITFIDGAGAPRYSLVGEKDTALRFRAEEYMALMFGKASDDSLTDPENGNKKITLTRGLEETIRTQGMVEPMAAGAMSLTFFDTLIKRIDKRRGPKEYKLKPGIDIDFELSNIITPVMQQDSVSYSMVGGKGVAELLGWSSFKRAGYSFHKEVDPLMSHDKLMGSAGHNYQGKCFMIPLDKMKDEESNQMMYAYAIRVKKGYKKNRDFDVWETGSNASTPTDQIDVRQINYRSEKLLQVMGGYRYLLLEYV